MDCVDCVGSGVLEFWSCGVLEWWGGEELRFVVRKWGKRAKYELKDQVERSIMERNIILHSIEAMI